MASYNAVNNTSHLALNNYGNNSPYGSGDPYYSASTGYIAPQTGRKRPLSNWVKFGVPIAIIIIVAAVIGGVLGSRAHHNSPSVNAASSPGSAAQASQAVSAKNAIGRFPTATNSEYLLPIYP